MTDPVVGDTDIVTGFLEEQKEFSQVYAGGPEQLSSLRSDGLREFSGLGIPDFKHEEWKYTHISKKLTGPYSVAKQSPDPKNEAVDPFRLAGTDSYDLVFVNGIYSEELSTPLITDEIVVAPLSLIPEGHRYSELPVGEICDTGNDHFTALNTAFINEIAVIAVARNKQPDKPVHIINLSGSDSDKLMSFPRLFVELEDGASATLVENYGNPVDSSVDNFSAAVSEYRIGKNAELHSHKFQSLNDRSKLVVKTYVHQEQDSRSHSFVLSTTGELIRNNLDIKLSGPNANAELHGVYLPSETQVVDNHTLVDHVSPDCYSNELYKGVMGGKSEAVFNGKVFVRRDSQRTNAYQSNKNILLTDDAQINTKPQLEIYADDVKCSHGATTGQLDEDALFYLRARGIGEQTARSILVKAFAGEVLKHLKDITIRENFSHIIDVRLQKMNAD